MALQRIMRRFRINEISAVDRPAQAHAKVTIFKRKDDAMPWTAADAERHNSNADTPEKQRKWAKIANAALADGHDEGAAIRIANAGIAKMSEDDPYWKREFTAEQRRRDAESGAAEPDGSFPIHNATDLHNAMRAIGRSKNPAKTKAHIRARAKALGLTHLLTDAFKRDDIVTKVMDVFWGARLQKAREALVKSVQSIVDNDEAADKDELIGKTVDEFVGHVADLSADLTKALAGGEPADKEDDEMSPELKKALGLPETATADDVTAAVHKLAAAADRSKDDELARLRRENEILKAGMSDEEKAFHDSLSDDGEKEKFRRAGKDERARMMHKREPQIYELAKKVADSDLELAKRAAENDALKKRIAKLEEERELEEFKKRAVEAGLPESEGATLMALSKAGEKAALERMLGITKSAIAAAKEGGLFKEFGATGRTEPMSAYEELEAKAAELRKADPKLTKAQAFAKVYADPENKELVKRERLENRPAGAAA